MGIPILKSLDHTGAQETLALVLSHAMTMSAGEAGLTPGECTGACMSHYDMVPISAQPLLEHRLPRDTFGLLSKCSRQKHQSSLPDNTGEGPETPP